ncbi:hypothetical protein TSUD_150210 [Trifolium subterraneum]|uniref:ATP-dependent DNA helicase n=1 Tax=Trifolium subterraneum TaxID=3900 RepID=A0A2Z6NM69_TRISU|nr:hypothetical protein TSUD_150210 [Trifolium subterraneum]
MYNSMFAFTSPGMKFDKNFKGNRGPPVLRLQGQPCHRIGSMLPKPGEPPKFAQLYIYDTDNEIHNRIESCGNNKEIDAHVVAQLGAMLDEHNVLAKGFRMARDRLREGNVKDLKLRLINDRKTDGRIYNLPTVSEVAALIVGDVDEGETRDIIVQEQSGKLERISEFHPSYLGYQYPLIFPYGEDGFRRGTLHKELPNVPITKRNRLTIMDWLAFRIQTRKHEGQTLINSRRLFQQFLVDGFTMMEAERLSWVRNNQSTLRVGKYQKLHNKQGSEQKTGKRVVLPSSFVGSKRYMDQLYFDAEIPNPETQRDLYHLVKKHMIHGPCGITNKSSPCMTDKNCCSKFFPKKNQPKTIVDKDGYPVYRRRSNGYTIEKSGQTMDNRHVVPYNPFLLLKYQAHINMEWCNQCTSIKYLFKYINKGFDRITASISRSNAKTDDIDEVKEYIDCRYVSPSEACWRIFGFSIHGRKPAVERLYYHLEGEHSVYFQDYENIDDVLLKPSVTESMFTSWMLANQKYREARTLTYGQFVSKFVYHKKKEWRPRKRGYTIGRLIWVPPSTGELYYFRMMLTVVKGPTCYNDIMKVGDEQYVSYRDACFAMGFLEDDRVYINAIKEAKDWGSGHFLRKLFVIMLLSNSMNRPKHVWDETKCWLSDGILYNQRLIANNRELELTEEEIDNLTLIEIQKCLEANRKSLTDFKPIPFPKEYVTAQLGNRMIYDEKNYDVHQQRIEFQTLFQKLTASSGIASLLLPGGRTAHSKFKIPVPTLEKATCDIHYNDDRAGLLRETKLIIWDEAPMAHRFCFEALDTTLKDVMSEYNNSDKPFGGKVIVFGGDFRQILLVVPRGSRSDIVHASINSSKI